MDEKSHCNLSQAARWRLSAMSAKEKSARAAGAGYPTIAQHLHRVAQHEYQVADLVRREEESESSDNRRFRAVA